MTNIPELLQQALDALEVAHAGLEWYRDGQPEAVNGSDDEADEVIGSAMQALRDAMASPAAPAVQAGQWIAVADRMPPEDEPVLISYHAYGEPDGERLYAVAAVSLGNWIDPHADDPMAFSYYAPTHWQPLAAPGAVALEPAAAREGVSDEREKDIARAADFLEQYADFIRREVMAVDIEQHPYLPELEEVAGQLRAMPSPVDGGQTEQQKGGV